MKRVYLIRSVSDDRQTLGALVTQDGKSVFTCRTLELPWKNNQHNISCIPAGTYKCSWTRSPLFSLKAGKDVYTFEVLGVPARGGIRIHSANYFHDLLGCIALGDAHKDIDIDGQLDVIHSGDTIAAFNKLMNQETFELVILNLL
jgi:hypothetical protein